MRILRGNVSASSGIAPPAGGTAASDFRLEARVKGRRYARAQSAGTSTVSATPPSVTRWKLHCNAGKSAALGASLGVGPAPPVVWQDEPATPLPAPFLRGTAPPCSNLPAIPPHLCRDESRQKCSGQAGHSRPHPLPAVGADSVSHRRSALRHSPPSSSCAACHRLRGSARISVVDVVLLFDGQCLFAEAIVPRINVISRSLLWAVPAQAPEAVCLPTTSVSSAVPGSLTSPFHGAPEPADPHAARPLPGPRSTRFARSAPLVTGRL